MLWVKQYQAWLGSPGLVNVVEDWWSKSCYFELSSNWLASFQRSSSTTSCHCVTNISAVRVTSWWRSGASPSSRAACTAPAASWGSPTTSASSGSANRPLFRSAKISIQCLKHSVTKDGFTFRYNNSQMLIRSLGRRLSWMHEHVLIRLRLKLLQSIIF